MRSLISVILLTGCASFAQAQTRSLNYYLFHAINNSPKIAAQRNKADSARLQKKIINANYDLPLISARANYLYAPMLGNYLGFDPAITNNGGTYDALVNIAYPLFTGKKENVRNHSSSIAIRRANYRIEKAKHQLRKSIAKRYITAYQDLTRLQYLRRILKLLKRQKKVVTSLAKRGITRIIDVKQIGIQLQSNRIAQKKVKKTYRQHLMQLKIASGITTAVVPAGLKTPVIAIDTSSTVQHSRFMARFKLDSLKTAAQQQIFELKYRPNITAFGNTGFKSNHFTGLQNTFGYNVGFNISIPIFDGNKKKITRQQTQLQQNSIDVRQRRFRKKRQLHLVGLRKRLHQTEQQLALIQKQISQYKSLLKDYRRELSRGLVKTVNYLTVLRQYIKARQQQVQVRGNLLKIKNKYKYWNW